MQKLVLNEDHLYDDLKSDTFLQHLQLQAIGKGGFGEVFVCPIEPNVYALKKLSASGKDLKTLESIKSEIKNLEQIRDISPKPSSIPVYHGHFLLKLQLFNDVTYCLIFDHFPKTLKSLIKEHKASHSFLPFKVLETYFRDFLFGMAFLQSVGISHRDLKPGNLMLDPLGTLKIIDYGLAKDIRELESQASSSRSRFAFDYEGTPDYMAPELEGSVRYNPFKADVFSFGLIILELATMEKPQRKVSLQAFDKGITDQLRRMEMIYQDADKKRVCNMSRTLKECLSGDVEDRPDFLQVFRDSLGIGEEGMDKIKFHIKLEHMNIEE